MAHSINLCAGSADPSVYENTEAVILFLCQECVEYIHSLSLPEAVLEFVDYEKKRQGYRFTETGVITSALIKNKQGFIRIILAGIGAGKACTPNHMRTAAGNAVRELSGNRIHHAVAAGPVLQNPKRSHYLKALAEGLLLGNYSFEKYKTKSKTDSSCKVTILSAVENSGSVLREAEIICKAVCHARDLANEPGNAIYPGTLAESAVKTAKESGLESEVLSAGELKSLGMNAMLAVGSGSSHEPKLVTLKYANGGNRPFVAFVGKGITFDSGGISIKPGDGMGEMKDDMTGAAAVLGAMEAIAALGLKVNVTGIMACAENMPSGTAQRPGDIVTAASGKTIEVVNTDAEGRMVLADAVWYACRKGASTVIDIATLTGAVIIALGEHTSGIISNDGRLAEAIRKAGHRAGEEWWQLPIPEEAEKMIESSCADVKNSAGRPAGTITGGVFIGSFVDKGIPWAHLDIGGTSTAKKTEGHIPEGCTAFGTATLIEYARSMEA